MNRLLPILATIVSITSGSWASVVTFTGGTITFNASTAGTVGGLVAGSGHWRVDRPAAA